MIKIMGIFVCMLLITTVVSADNDVQHILLNNSFKKELYHNYEWEIEYGDSMCARRVATDSMNNVILIGVGGNNDIELPFAVIVKYGIDGEIIWHDHRTAPIIPDLISSKSFVSGSISQTTGTVSIKQISRVSKTPTDVKSSIGSEVLPGVVSPDIFSDFIIGAPRYFVPTSSDTQILFGGRWVRFYDIVVDDNDDIVVVGEIQNRFTKDLRTVYVIKYDSDGNVLWDRIYKRYWLTPRDLATGVALDSNNNIFVSVISQEKNSEDYKGLILKLSSNNGAKLDEFIYPNVSIIFSGVAVDSEDNVYVTGYYTPSGKMIVTKYSNDLKLLDEWGPAIRPVRPIAIDVDQDDNVIVAGGVGFYGNEKQYLTKFSPDGTILWSNTSNDGGVWYDAVALSSDVTAATGIKWGNDTYGLFYVGLYDENGHQLKRFLGGNKTLLNCYFSYGLDVDNNGDIVVGGFRWYGTFSYYMHAMKFYQ